MLVTVRGFSRDHGSWILWDEQVEQIAEDPKNSECPEKESVLQEICEDGSTSLLKIRKRVHLNLNGNYVLEVTLSVRDIARLFWLTFRERALSSALRIFGDYETKQIEIEKMISEIQARKSFRRRF